MLHDMRDFKEEECFRGKSDNFEDIATLIATRKAKDVYLNFGTC